MPMSTAKATYSLSVLEPCRSPEKADYKAGKLTASATYAQGVIVGEVTATPGVYKIYASGNSDGSQNPVGAVTRACVTDASGNVSYSDSVNGDEYGELNLTARIAISGYFRTEDLVGLDANAVAKLGRLISGSVTTGEVHIY